MAIKTTPGARSHEDHAGDPLDGLVNLFDLGIVLAVAFLLAALSSLDLTNQVFDQKASRSAPQIKAKEDEALRPLKLNPGERLVGRGERVGAVYRLDNGRLVYVAPKASKAKGSP